MANGLANAASFASHGVEYAQNSARSAWLAPCIPAGVPDGSPTSPIYAPRPAAGTPLQQLVGRTLPELAGAVDYVHGGRLPRFVHEALDAYAHCGEVALGAVRLRCGTCRVDRLVAFTCKNRVVCASCGGRRMTDMASHLLDEVVPVVPIRQWVLTVPFPLRFRMTVDAALVRAVRTALAHALRDHVIARYVADAAPCASESSERARAALESRVGRIRTGAITVTQRFGSGLNLHVHFHVLATDGVFVGDSDTLRFRDVGLFRADDVGEVLRCTVDALVAQGTFDDATDAPGTDPDQLTPHDDLALASVHHRIGLGARRGQRVERVGTRLRRELAERKLTVVPGRMKAQYGGFDLEAAVRIPKLDRRALERLMRYVLRPALGEGRLHFGDADGKVTLQLKSAWPDGTTHLRFTPLELVEKLAALVPRPHENLLVYHGVFAGNARHRHAYVSYGRDAPVQRARLPVGDRATADDGAPRTLPTRMRRDWATLMKRGLGIDVLSCPRCGHRMRLLAIVADRRVAARIAEHLHLGRSQAGPPSVASRRTPSTDFVETRIVYDEPPPPDYDD